MRKKELESRITELEAENERLEREIKSLREFVVIPETVDEFISRIQRSQNS